MLLFEAFKGLFVVRLTTRKPDMRNLREMIRDLYKRRNAEVDSFFRPERSMRRNLIRDLIVICRMRDKRIERRANG